MEALPGYDITEERTVLGTFWRDTALEQEEIEYFATGHDIVEALFGFLRDGPYGRNGMRFLEKRGPMKAKGLELLFHIVPPEAQDTSPGARVPSRQLSRFLDRWLIHVAVTLQPAGVKSTSPAGGAQEVDGRSLKETGGRCVPRLQFRGQAAKLALALAGKQLRPGTSLAGHRDERSIVLRAKLAPAPGVPASRIEQVMREELSFADAAGGAGWHDGTAGLLAPSSIAELSWARLSASMCGDVGVLDEVISPPTKSMTLLPLRGPRSGGDFPISS